MIVEAAQPQGDSDDLEVIETVTAALGDDGTVVVDDLVAVVDADGVVVATDETIAVEAPDGTVVVDEVVAIADDDGTLIPVTEEAQIDAPRDGAVAAPVGEAARHRLGPRALVVAAAVLAVTLAIIARSRRRRGTTRAG